MKCKRQDSNKLIVSLCYPVNSQIEKNSILRQTILNIRYSIYSDIGDLSFRQVYVNFDINTHGYVC